MTNVLHTARTEISKYVMFQYPFSDLTTKILTYVQTGLWNCKIFRPKYQGILLDICCPLAPIPRELSFRWVISALFETIHCISDCKEKRVYLCIEEGTPLSKGNKTFKLK